MDFRVLGPIEVAHDDGGRLRIGSRMQRRLLAVLLVQGGYHVSAERLVDVLWDGAPPPSAPAGLHTYVSRLRRVLGDATVLEYDAQGYRLLAHDDQVDARRFERLVARACTQLEQAPAEAAAGLAEALALWRGRAYAEVADEDFARPEAVRLEELRLGAIEDAFAARLATGDTGVVADLDAFARANPLRERPHAQLMTALAQAGRQTEALSVFQRLRGRLADDLGLEPSPSLQQLQADILRQAPSVTPPATPARTGEDAESAQGNLPRPVTSFVGRQHETEAVRRLLDRGRLVTLTGVGGVGKTRLALQAAATVADRYPDGVWWCDLAPADAGAVGHTVATVLGVHQQAHRDVADSLVAALAGKRLLLVLDNCEHVVEATARLAEHLLRNAPGISLLATGREPLAVDGEQMWLVPPLTLPADRMGGEDTDAPAARLFWDRATSHWADISGDDATAAAVADICRQLDGLPLAIELAAALVPALEPAEIARRLGQRFRLLTHGPRADPRHRSLDAVVEWSYQLLDPAEQRLFDRLGVLVGGFTLATAEGLCADEELSAERIAGLLTGLVNRSMVAVDRDAHPARYRLLETLRQYAVQRLAARGEEDVLRERHAVWFVALAERADVEVRGPGEAEAVAVLEAELANLRAAHRWAIEHEDSDLALRLAAALYVFARWRLRDEVSAWASEAAELAGVCDHRLLPLVRGVVAHGLSQAGDLTRARELAERALEEASSGVPGLFVPLRVLSSVALYEGRLEECRALTERALAAAEGDGDAYSAVWMGMHDVLSLVYGGHREAALEAAARQWEAAEALESPNMRGWALYVQAEACGDAEPDRALELLERAITLARPVNDRYLEGVSRVALIALRARHQSPHEALSAFPEVIHHWRRAGDWIHQWTTLRNLVPLLVRLGADEPAARLSGAVHGAGTPAPPFGADAVRVEHARESLSERLGAEAFRALAEEGAGLDGPQAVDLALTASAEVLGGETPSPARAAPTGP
ncbi:AfsR/SARP family transcriptional regulator [Egibacter rhizosphaerae]|nr:BTAD domain-containing putative transcriptional regulator [Egibacter rhizosphaerae]